MRVIEEWKAAGRGLAGAVAALGVLAGVTGCVEIRVPDPAVHYVAFGDSMTRGPSDRDYPDILRELLGEPLDAFANEGQSGETSDEGRGRLNDLVALDLYPNVRILSLLGGRQRYHRVH